MRPTGRSAQLVRLLYGAALLAVPGRLAQLVTGAPAPGRTVTVMRVLGVRHVTQAAVNLRYPQGWVHKASTALDAAHLASLGPIAKLCDEQDRRLVRADAVLEAFFAAEGGRRLR